MAKNSVPADAPITQRQTSGEGSHRVVMHLQEDASLGMRRTWLTFHEGLVRLELDHGARPKSVSKSLSLPMKRRPFAMPSRTGSQRAPDEGPAKAGHYARSFA